jgi:ribosomal protein S18 acetylase RimI-like enzyme
MTTLTFRRLDPSNTIDRSDWRQVFRGAPSFTYATEGRTPTDDDADRMIDTLPRGKQAEDVFIYAISAGGALCGCAYVARHYPAHGDANLVLLVLMENHQRRYFGVRCLSWIEGQARSWGCTRLTGVVDTANQRAFRFWQRLGFQEERRQRLPWLVAEAAIGHIPLGSNPSIEGTSTSKLRLLAAAPHVKR